MLILSWQSVPQTLAPPAQIDSLIYQPGPHSYSLCQPCPCLTRPSRLAISFPCFAWELSLWRFASTWTRDRLWTQSVPSYVPRSLRGDSVRAIADFAKSAILSVDRATVGKTYSSTAARSRVSNSTNWKKDSVFPSSIRPKTPGLTDRRFQSETRGRRVSMSTRTARLLACEATTDRLSLTVGQRFIHRLSGRGDGTTLLPGQSEAS